MRELGYVEGKDFVVEARFAPESQSLCSSDGTGARKRRSHRLKRRGGGFGVEAGYFGRSRSICNHHRSRSVWRSRQFRARPGVKFHRLVHPSHGRVTPSTSSCCNRAVPKLSRIAALANPANINHAPLLEIIQSAAARARGVAVVRAGRDADRGNRAGIGALARQPSPASTHPGAARFSVQYFPRKSPDLPLRNRPRNPSICGSRIPGGRWPR